MAAMGFYDYRAMVEERPVETFIIELRDRRRRLVSACLTDRLGTEYRRSTDSSIPQDARRSLGTHTILWLVEQPRRGLPYVYLGYWVPGASKMAYKARFPPAGVLRPRGLDGAAYGLGSSRSVGLVSDLTQPCPLSKQTRTLAWSIAPRYEKAPRSARTGGRQAITRRRGDGMRAIAGLQHDHRCDQREARAAATGWCCSPASSAPATR